MRGSWRDRQETPTSEPFKSLKQLATWLIFLFSLSIAVDALAILSGISYLGLIDRVQGGVQVFTDEISTIENRISVIGITQVVLWVVTAIVFVVWFRRAYRNLGPLGASWLRFKPGWAVGAWFVPILNAIRPKEIANDIWRVSDPELPPTLDGPALGRPVSAVLNWWWAMLLISGSLGRAAFRSADAETLEELSSGTKYGVAADVASVIAAVLAIILVKAVTDRQHRRHELVARTLASEVPSPQA